MFFDPYQTDKGANEESCQGVGYLDRQTVGFHEVSI